MILAANKQYSYVYPDQMNNSTEMVKVWEVDDSEEYNGIEKQFLNQSIEIMSQDLVASSRAAQHQPMCDRRKNNA